MGKCCMNCLRVFFIIINVIALLLGLCLIALSLFAYFHEMSQGMREFLNNDSMAFDLTLFVILAIGVVTVLISIFGCCGAFFESSCLLASYLVCLLLVVGAEVACGTYLYIQQAHDKIDGVLNEKLGPKLRGRNASAVPLFIMEAQRIFNCCGINGTEYGDAANKICLSRDNMPLDKVGCASRISKSFKEGWVCALIIIVSVAVIELLAIALALSICCCSRREEEGYVGVNAD